MRCSSMASRLKRNPPQLPMGGVKCLFGLVPLDPVPKLLESEKDPIIRINQTKEVNEVVFDCSSGCILTSRHIIETMHDFWPKPPEYELNTFFVSRTANDDKAFDGVSANASLLPE